MKRSLQLDFLRFCGVFLVMINHIVIKNNGPLDQIFHRIWIGGWIGVDLFFVLSGYLVSGLIFKEYSLYHSFNAKRFLIRRGFKIYPSYYIFLITAFVFNILVTHGKGPYHLIQLFHESIFVSNYLSYTNLHLWSICVEEHFYVLLAILLFFLIRYGKIERRYFVYVYVGLLILGLACRFYNYIHYPNYDVARDYIKSHFRFDALFFGVLLSYIANFESDLITKLLTSKFRFLLLAFSLLFLSTNFIFDRPDFRFVSVLNLALNPICFGYLMLVVINYQNALFLKLITPLSFIGKYSYSIYLFHRLFNSILFHLFRDGGRFYYPLYFIVAITGGIIISKCIEYPLINLREKYFPSRSQKLASI